MALEAGTFISDLVATNPPGTDKKKQGDDHIRLIKAVLQASFPNSSKAFYIPTTLAKSANFSVVAADMNKTFLIDTTGGQIVATLPTLAVGDAGWECSFLKTNTGTNAYFIAPPSGTIQSGDQSGLTRARRCIPGARSKAVWTGTAWIAERVVFVPVGTVLDIPRSGLPVGYEYASGQTLASASTDYPAFYTSNGNSGVVTDRRGRIAVGRDDMVGGAAGRVGAVITGTAVGNTGGNEIATLSQANLPSGINLSSGNLTWSQTANNLTANGQSWSGGTTANGTVGSNVPGAASFSNISIGGSISGSVGGSVPLGGSGTGHANLQPSIITNYMVVVE